VAELTGAGGRPLFTAACTGCGACLLTCPTHAIRPRAGGRRPEGAGRTDSPARTPGTVAVLYAVAPLCTACGECVEVCPADAVELAPQPLRAPAEGVPGDPG
jgi:electron transport complex protein RnfB